MEYPSTCRTTSVASAVASTIGTTMPSTVPVSSSTRTMPLRGACVAAPTSAAAVTTA
jgi:hypothetical protein